MLARGDDDAEPRAGVDVDMGIDAALADQPQLGQPFQERCADLRSLAEQDQHLGVGEPFGQAVDVLLVVVPDRHLVALELGKARQGAQRVEIVVQDRDLHGAPPWRVSHRLRSRCWP
jgi:hypothetical protein